MQKKLVQESDGEESNKLNEDLKVIDSDHGCFNLGYANADFSAHHRGEISI